MIDGDYKKKTRGRPPIKRDEEIAKRVKQYIAVGTTREDVARVIGINVKTLANLYASELETAAAEANASVAGMLFQQCKDGNVAAQIFWLKTRARWSEKNTLEVTGDADNPMQTVTKVILAPLTKE